jgi:hypothetical protein
MIWVVYPGSRIPDADFFLSLISDPDPDPGVKKALDPGYGYATLETKYQLPLSLMRGVGNSSYQ